MKLKKLMSLGLALIMAMALASPALATDVTVDDVGSSSSFTTVYSGANNTKVPTVRVLIEEAEHIIFNPYKLKAKMVTGGNSAEALGSLAGDNVTDNVTIVKDQIISRAMTVTNQTNVAMRVGVTLAVKPKNSGGADKAATVVKNAPGSGVTAKQVYVYADFAVFDGSESDLASRSDAWLTKQRLAGDTAQLDSSNNWDGTSGGKNEVKSGAGGIFVPAPTAKPSGYALDTNFLYVKLGGAATATPEEAWSDADTLDVYIQFKIVPLPTTLYKLLACNYTSSSTSFASGFTVGTGAVTTFNNTSGFPTITVPYKKDAVDVRVPTGVTLNATAPGYEDAAKTKLMEGNIESGMLVSITPPLDGNKKPTHTITSINFYDANGTKLSSPKAASTNTKDKAAPWTFTMPAQNLVIEITMATAGS